MNKIRVVCYGDSNTYGADPRTGGRFDDDVRWTTRLGALLGDRYEVRPEGLSGRTTVFDDPLCEGLSGLATLRPVLSTNSPIDLLILMLGTNDCKARFAATGYNIAEGLRVLLQTAKQLPVWRDGPRILVLAPMKIDPRIETVPTVYGHMGPGCAEKSAAMVPWMLRFAAEEGCDALDINPFVSPNELDWMHISELSQLPLAKAVAEKVRSVLGENCDD